MISIKLTRMLDKIIDFVIINKLSTSEHDIYEINSAKQWDFLSNFINAYLIISIKNYDDIITSINKKFVYNMDYILTNDIDFEYMPIYPISPFTGSFDGYNHTIKNINIENSENNGLFGIVNSSTIKNITIQNVVITNGSYNACLLSKGYNVNLSNIRIIGNILLYGDNCSCVCNIFEGVATNILICVDGEINANMNKSFISNFFNGICDHINIISKLNNNIGYFNEINGKLSDSNIISFNTITNPFYNTTKYHIINNLHITFFLI
jgi:hypothetical protein